MLAYLLYKAFINQEMTNHVLETYVLQGFEDKVKEVVPFFSGVRN